MVPLIRINIIGMQIVRFIPAFSPKTARIHQSCGCSCQDPFEFGSTCGADYLDPNPPGNHGVSN
jgi:hypothetical protein